MSAKTITYKEYLESTSYGEINVTLSRKLLQSYSKGKLNVEEYRRISRAFHCALSSLEVIEGEV